MYLVVMVVLSIVLSIPRPDERWLILREPGPVIAALAAVTLLPAAWMAWQARRALRKIDAEPDDPGPGQAIYARATHVTHVLLGTLQSAVLLTTAWMRMCRKTPAIGEWPVMGALLAVVPFLISILLVWIAAYPAERAIRQIAVEQDLLRGRPAHPVWSLGQFLAYSFRHKVLFILAPMLLIVAARDVIELYEDRLIELLQYKYAPDLLLGAAAGLVAIVAPVLIRYIWVTTPLPEGPLRDRLTHLCRQVRLRHGGILVWRTGGMLANAALVGVVPPLRYVLITDALLEQMDDAQIEAVFGHEAGHAKRHHLLCFLLFALVSGCLLAVVSVMTNQRLDIFRYPWLLGGAAAVMAVKWFVVFFWIARRFEEQADAFGARALALTGIPCALPCAAHANRPGGPPPIEGPVCTTAASIFSDTLNAIARLNGIPPESSDLLHPSISARSRFLQRIAADPAAAERFERNIRALKLAIFVAAVGSAVWAATAMRMWEWLGL
jgi:STE24 endopeptidase